MEAELKEMMFNLGNDRDAIAQLKSHELRSVYTNLLKSKFIEDMPNDHAFITLDYGQKLLPVKPYERQSEYYAKRGLSWHFAHVIARIEGTLVTHLADSRSTVTIVTNLLKELHVAGIAAVTIRSDNGPNYHCAPTLGSIIGISEESKVTIKEWTFSEVQNGKGPSDRGAAEAKFELRKQVNAGTLTIEDQKSIFEGLKKKQRPGFSVYIGTMSDPATEPPASVITRVTDFSHFKNEGDHLRVWKYYGIGEGEVFKKVHYNGGVYKEEGRAGALADFLEAARDKQAIKNRRPAKFWHYEPSLLDTVEPGDRDQDAAVDPEPKTKDGKKGLAFACECGSVFLKLANYLKHHDLGQHKKHPHKFTSMDEYLFLYKSTIEETVQAHSLTPLQDAINAVYDKTVGFLVMGWGLRSAKRNVKYPENTKKWIQAFVVERRKQGKRADPGEAFKKMIADKSIDLDERMSKEQIKRYICRLVLTPVPKAVVLRAKRTDAEKNPENAVDWIVTEVEEGEWEIEKECREEDLKDDYDHYWEFYETNQKDFFSHE